MPKASVSPEAMMKIIMPIARPAAVSVTKVETEPMKGKAIAATISGVSAGEEVHSRPRQRGADVDRAHWCESRERPSRRPCSAESAAKSAIAPVMDDAAVVHDAHVIADFARDAEILFDDAGSSRRCA